MFYKKITWTVPGHTFNFEKPAIMGILNVTPDSFSDGGRFPDVNSAVEHGLKLAKDGADIIDVGGESTRPGSDEIDVETETSRVIPVIEGLMDSGLDIPISIDTRRLEVASKSVRAGAKIINDVSALRSSPEMALFAAETGVGIILMHMLGNPRSMQENPCYVDVIREIRDFLSERVQFAESQGISRESIAIDPGIGFGKNLAHNLAILRETHELLEIGRPVLIGPSRKRFIGELTGEDTGNRLGGTVAACVVSLMAGARLFRVHDVSLVRQALDVAHAIIMGENVVVNK